MQFVEGEDDIKGSRSLFSQKHLNKAINPNERMSMNMAVVSCSGGITRYLDAAGVTSTVALYHRVNETINRVTGVCSLAGTDSGQMDRVRKTGYRVPG